MKKVITPFHALAAAAGVLAMSTDTLSNVEFMLAQTGTLFDSNILGVIALAIGGVFALTAGLQAIFRQRHLLTGAVLIIGWAVAMGFSLYATFDRVATQRDQKMASVFAKDAIWDRLDKAHAQASREAARECSTGRGKMCEIIEAQVDKVEERKRAREADLDSSGKRIAYYLAWAGATPNGISMWAPALMPVALLILGQWLTAFGLAGQMVRPEFEESEADQKIAKARRFIEHRIDTTGRKPSPGEVIATAGIGRARAARLLAEA